MSRRESNKVNCLIQDCEYHGQMGKVCLKPKKAKECDHDIFKCKNCGYVVIKDNVLETRKCPDCGTKNWDFGNVTCSNCGHTYHPKTDMPKYCPKCSEPFETIQGGKGGI